MKAAAAREAIHLIVEAPGAGGELGDGPVFTDSNVVTLDLYRMQDIRELARVLRNVYLLSKSGLLCLGLETSLRRREWLRTHEDRLRGALGRVLSVSLTDGSRRWTIRRDVRFRLRFPDDFPDKFRIFFWVDDGGDDSELQLSNTPVRFEVSPGERKPAEGRR